MTRGYYWSSYAAGLSSSIIKAGNWPNLMRSHHLKWWVIYKLFKYTSIIISEYYIYIYTSIIYDIYIYLFIDLTNKSKEDWLTQQVNTATSGYWWLGRFRSAAHQIGWFLRVTTHQILSCCGFWRVECSTKKKNLFWSLIFFVIHPSHGIHHCPWTYINEPPKTDEPRTNLESLSILGPSILFLESAAARPPWRDCFWAMEESGWQRRPLWGGVDHPGIE